MFDIMLMGNVWAVRIQVRSQACFIYAPVSGCATKHHDLIALQSLLPNNEHAPCTGRTVLLR